MAGEPAAYLLLRWVTIEILTAGCSFSQDRLLQDALNFPDCLPDPGR
jgi:hypothetical protein